MSEKTLTLCIKAIGWAVMTALIGIILLAILNRPIPSTLSYVVFQGIGLLIGVLLNHFTTFAGKRSVSNSQSWEISEHDSDEFEKR